MAKTTADHHQGHLVCTTCYRLRSIDSDPDRFDRDECRCTHTDRDHGLRELGVPCRICAACGLAIAPGHSRWRQNFCSGCRRQFVEIQALLGWFHIPLGIHSIVNQARTISGDELAAMDESPAGARLRARRANELATDLTKMSRGIDHLYDHVDRLAGERLAAIGLTSEPTVPWHDYVAACRDACIVSDHGWAALLQEFGLSDWIDDVQAFRATRNTSGAS